MAVLSDWRVEGTENVPAAGPLLVVANHFSFVDPPLLAASISRPMTFVAKAELWEATPARLFCQAIRMLPIRRGEADRTALRGALRVLEAGRALAFFPEGTRGKEPVKRLKQAHDGIAFLARLSGAPVLPVGIYGTEVIDTTNDIVPQALRRPAFRVRIGETFKLPPKTIGKSSQTLSADTAFIMAHIARLLPEHYRGYYAEDAQRLSEHEGTTPAP